jgi:hypothetical protein
MPDITVNSTTGFSPLSSDADRGANVKLTSAQGNGTLSVYTYMKNASNNWQLADVFNGNKSSPYDATEGGKTYMLKNAIKNKAILLSLSNPPMEAGLPTTPTNGTINVGGGGKDEPGGGEEQPGGGEPR